VKAWLGIGITLAAIVAAAVAPWLAPVDPLASDFAQSLRPPGAPGHPLGTDQLGRDLLARVLYGARLALFIGACTVVVTAVVGSLLGLVAGFHRPGGNLSGVTMLTLALDLQRLSLLREALPKAASIAVLINPNFPGSPARIREVQDAARGMVQDLALAGASNEGEIDRAFARFDRRRPDALLVAGDPFLNARRDQIVALAARYAVPALYDGRDFAAAGGLMSYGTQLPDLYRKQGAYTALVLKETNPADLPVLQPTRFELVINLKTAKALGLEVPPTLIARADEVIE